MIIKAEIMSCQDQWCGVSVNNVAWKSSLVKSKPHQDIDVAVAVMFFTRYLAIDNRKIRRPCVYSTFEGYIVFTIGAALFESCDLFLGSERLRFCANSTL